MHCQLSGIKTASIATRGALRGTYVRPSPYTATAPPAPCLHTVIDSYWDATMRNLLVLVPYTTSPSLYIHPAQRLIFIQRTFWLTILCLHTTHTRTHHTGVLEGIRAVELLTVGAYYKTSSTAFVTMSSHQATITAHQLFLSHVHYSMVVKSAPNPKG